MDEANVAIVGGGALGAATAWALARHGETDVVLLDRADPPEGTTGRGAGLITPLVKRPSDVGLVQWSKRRFDELARNHAEVTVRETGGLLIADREDRALTRRLERMWKAQGVSLRRVDERHLEDLPGLEGLRLDDEEHAFYSEADAWASPSACRAAMIREAKDRGAKLVPAPVDQVDHEGIHAEGGRLEAEHIVLAAGAWTPRVVPEGRSLPLGVYRAQAARLGMLRGDSPGALVHDAVNGCYWRPGDGEEMIVGDGTDLDRHDPSAEPEPDASIGPSLAERFTGRVPGTSVEVVETWAGFEAGTPDARPLVGRLEGRPDVVVCAGGNGFGFMRAPALGAIAAGCVLDEPSPFPTAPYRPDRFEDPEAGFDLKEGFSLDGEDP